MKKNLVTPPITEIYTALAKNETHVSNLLPPINYKSIGTSGGKELLVPIFLDFTGYKGYWYGYIQQATQGLDGYFAMLVWLTKPVIGQSNDERLTSFHNLTWGEGLFEPATIQNEHDAFIHTDSFERAVKGLANIVLNFDIEKRFPREDSPYYDDPVDMSILMLTTEIKDLILLNNG